MNFRRMMIAAVIAAAGLWTAAAQAEETVVWWDFLGGGDGVRMKQLISDFNTAHAGKIKIDATTLEWGTPFYAKVQTSAAVGEAPDVMTYHASRIPLAVSQDILRRNHRRRHGQDGPVERGLRTGDLGRRDRRRQAVRGAARYPSDRALLQPATC